MRGIPIISFPRSSWESLLRRSALRISILEVFRTEVIGRDAERGNEILQIFRGMKTIVGCITIG